MSRTRSKENGYLLLLPAAGLAVVVVFGLLFLMQALINSGISALIYGVSDPNPLFNHKGLADLKSKSISIEKFNSSEVLINKLNTLVEKFIFSQKLESMGHIAIIPPKTPECVTTMTESESLKERIELDAIRFYFSENSVNSMIFFFSYGNIMILL